jgi:hypothetical protein
MGGYIMPPLRLPGATLAPLVGVYEGHQNSKTKNEKSHPEKLFLLFFAFREGSIKYSRICYIEYPVVDSQGESQPLTAGSDFG